MSNKPKVCALIQRHWYREKLPVENDLPRGINSKLIGTQSEFPVVIEGSIKQK